MAKYRKSRIDDASRFLASTLHEIRTPIQTIISTLELLQETNLDKEQKEYTRQIQFSADVLLDLANNILDFTKIRSNQFKLESVPYSIKTLTEQVVDLISIEAFNRGLEIITDIDYNLPALVIGDPVRVQQIILNLLKNAIKFTNTGWIHVELKQSENSLFFKVTDTGIGISEDKKKKLFTDYFQADVSTYRLFGGTGLGLSICKNLVTVMKGTIGVETNPQGGSVFWFKIPLIKEPSADNKNLRDTISIPGGQKVLIVDDNTLAIESLKTKLINLNITDITCTQDSAQGLKLLEEAEQNKTPYTIAFIDMILPDNDGWHLASDINGNPSLKNKLQLYLLVPEGQMGSEAKMKMLNWFNGYLYKPVKFHQLTELMQQAFKDETEYEELESIQDEQPVFELEECHEELSSVKYRILVVEDHPVNRKLLETFLHKFGADVLLAEDGQEAVNMVKANPDIDLIFMDIQMPVKNGIEATVELRKDGYNGIIIACTANNDEGDFKAYRKVGINDILVKPFKSQTIKTVIEKWENIMNFPDANEIQDLDNSRNPRHKL